MMAKRKSKPLSQRQSKILSYIEHCIASYNHPPSIREICDECNISSTSVADYNLKQLEKKGYIERKSNVSRGIQVLRPIGSLQKEKNTVRVPLYGTITAGQPIYTPNNDMLAEEYIELSRELFSAPFGKELYALRVKDQSMIDALVDDGDIVVLAHQETANNGDMVAAQLLRDGQYEWTLKRFHQEGEIVQLRPANPAMFTEQDVLEKFTFPAQDVKISGKVCLVIRQV